MPASKRVMAYIDGFNLYHGMHEASGRRDLWLDLQRLLSHPAYVDPQRGQTLVGVHYFTAAVSGPGATNQAIYLEALAAASSCLTIHRGRFQRKTVTCHQCGSQWPSHEEKESDVSLAVQLVADVARNACARILLVSADADMCPAVRAAREIAGRPIEVLVIFPPNRRSDQLGRQADGVLKLFPHRLRPTNYPRLSTGPRASCTAPRIGHSPGPTMPSPPGSAGGSMDSVTDHSGDVPAHEMARVVQASREIVAPAARIFELIADPAQQPRWDGNDNLAEAEPGQRVRATGDVFRTMLTLGALRENHVVEFEEGALIAWRPSEPGKPQPGHLWRWQLQPLDGDRTLVTHTYDWSQLTDPNRFARARATTPDKLRQSLDRLAALAESGPAAAP